MSQIIKNNIEPVDFRKGGLKALKGSAIKLGLSVKKYTTPSYGWGGKTIGAETTNNTWLKLSTQPIDRLNEHTWTGETTATKLITKKPKLLRSLQWTDGSRLWSMDEFSLIKGKVISASPDIQEYPSLKEQWWKGLAQSLREVKRSETNRISIRQDYFNRRIELLSSGKVNPTVDNWTSIHGDLHWANLSGPDLCILDWEGWGQGPLGADEAGLWAFSLSVPELKQKIAEEFKSVFNTRTGKLSQLFSCAEVIFMTDNYKDHPHLKPLAQKESKRLLDELSTPTKRP